MWIRKAHYALLLGQIAELRSMARIREKELREDYGQRLGGQATRHAEQVRDLESRLAASESERRELTQTVMRWEDDRRRPPAPEGERRADSWEEIMRREVDELNKPEVPSA